VEYVDAGHGSPARRDLESSIRFAARVRRQTWPPAARLAPATAVLVRDARVAEKINWGRLVRLADERPVLLSLEAFGAAANARAPGVATLRVIRRRNRPVFAMVSDSSFITRGFALNDVFCYGWSSVAGHRSVQRCLVREPGLMSFCRQQRLVDVLTADSGTKRGGGHPLVLHRIGRQGFVAVMDVEPPPGLESARPVGPYHARLLSQMLGWGEPHSGQYAVSPACRQEFEQIVSSFCDRFPAARWVPMSGPDGDPPLGWMDIRARTSATDASSGPLRTIRIRTGFAADQWDIVMGVLTCLKQMVCRFADSSGKLAGLLWRFAIQWVPLCDPRAVPPAAAPDEYTYMIAVPPQMRRGRPVEKPEAPDVRIDLARAPGEAILVRPGGDVPRSLREQLAALSDSFGVNVELVRGPGAASGRAAAWQLAFPVEPDPRTYDSISATDRVVRVLQAVLAAYPR